MGRQQDRLAKRAQRADRLPGGTPCLGIKAGGRLVEEDQLGVADERQSEVEPAQLAAGELARAHVGLLLKAHQAQAPPRRRAGADRSWPSGAAPRAVSAGCRCRCSARRSRCACAMPARARRDRGRAPKPRRRCAHGSPPRSRLSSSCRRRWGRAGRRPRRGVPRRRCPAQPRTRRSACAGRGLRSRELAVTGQSYLLFGACSALLSLLGAPGLVECLGTCPGSLSCLAHV